MPSRRRGRGPEFPFPAHQIARNAATNEPDPTNQEQAAAAPADEGGKPLAVAALGASAGGLEALTQFLDQIPPDSGLAFVVVTHQHPGHASLLPELLAKHTSLPVAEAVDGDELTANRVYVAPTSGRLEVFAGRLQVISLPAGESFHLPIDAFLRALAEDQQERSVCVILSGTGTDGTLGLRAVKGAGGMAMVQDPESAKYAGMPRSAIDTGLADYILPAADMPRKMVDYVSGRYAADAAPARKDGLDKSLPDIFKQLRARTGHDFSSYKTSTLRRRIERRMNVQLIESPAVYATFLREHPHEVDQLFRELLITVTSFFRDPDAFQTLGESLLRLLESKSDEEAVRVWAPGCATGEEAYSVAILMYETLAALDKTCQVQVFGTDLDGDAIETARTGRYPEGIADDVDAQRLRRFFTKEDNGYRIKKEIREMVVFAPQNVIKDPPFTKLDLLSCRNLLIYLNSDLQKRLLPVFHYALNRDGLLFLGPSETIGEARDLFAVVHKKWKLYRRSENGSARHPEFPLSAVEHDVGKRPPVARSKTAALRSVRELVQEHLLTAFVPPAVVVDSRGDIVHVQGRTGPYLELPSGRVSTNLIDMARDGLQLDLAAALRQAGTHDGPVVHRHVQVGADDESMRVDIRVRKINDPEPIRGMFLVTFEPSAPSVAPLESDAGRDAGRDAKLSQELRYLKETLQTTIEEYETTNEELKSTNEELQSTNEELQSANEELETSKEEMQSLNEELHTVNAELSSKVDELSQTNDDMQNLLNSTELATLFLDNQLQVKRFTKSATKLFRIRDVDINRHLSEIVTDLDSPDLVDDVGRVLDTLVFQEREVLTKDGARCFRMRIMPYRTSDSMIDGVVLTFVDVNDVREARDFAQNIVATIPEPLLVLNDALRVVLSNPAFHHDFDVQADDVQGRRVYELGKGQWDVPRLRELLEQVVPANAEFQDFAVDHVFPQRGKQTLLLSGRRLEQRPHRAGLILMTIRPAPGRG